MLAPFTWILAVEVLGFLVFPIAFVLFHRLPDRGYAFTKPLALLLLAYLLWILGLTHLVPNSPFTILGVLLLGALFSGWVLRRNYQQIQEFVRSQWRTLLVAEVAFLGFFGVWLAIVSAVPAINHTEKPMDFAFFNAILQSRHFPPEDPWLSGHPISYYYFGHFIMASLTKLTGVSSAVGYNIAVALVPALLGIGSFGLLYNLVRLSGGSLKAGLGFGLLATALLMLVGNLEGVLEFAHALGWGSDGFWAWVGIKGLGSTAASGVSAFPEQPWWWWRATRVIDTVVDGQSLDYTITEFPFFSFILGDLHAHMLSLPFLVLFLALTMNLFVSQDKLGLRWLRRHPLESAALALVLGALAFINIWDFPVFGVLLAMIIFAKSYGQESYLNSSSSTEALSIAARNTGLMVGPLILAAVVLFIPFYLDLSSQASGILPVTGVGTRPLLFFLVMGLPVFIAVSFLLRQLPGLSRPSQQDAPTVLLVVLAAVVPLALWTIITMLVTSLADGIMAALAKVGGRLILALPGLVIAGLAGFSALQRARYQRDPIAAYPLLLVAAAFYLLSGAELFFLVDFFGNRMNTIFKVYFQSWLLLSIAGTYGLYHWQSQWHSGKTGLRIAQYAWAAVVVALVLASLYYPVGAMLDRTQILERQSVFAGNTLNGLAFVQESDPAEYAAILWLRDQAPRGRIVEAVGDDYSDYGRISASTGFPTILGWRGHEHQWRGTTRVFEGREEDVSRIYQSADPETVRRLLERYDVRYVYVGHRERSKYGAKHLDQFSGFLRTAFERDGVIIYERWDGVDPDPQPDVSNDPNSS